MNPMYWKRLGQKELLEIVLEAIDSRRFTDIGELKACLQRILIEIEQELRHYIEENDPIYSNLIQRTPVAQET